MIADITWYSETVNLSKRSFLFCFCEKHLTGMIEEINKTSTKDLFEVKVCFSESPYFEFKTGLEFTIQEASTILGKGEVKSL